MVKPEHQLHGFEIHTHGSANCACNSIHCVCCRNTSTQSRVVLNIINSAMQSYTQLQRKTPYKIYLIIHKYFIPNVKHCWPNQSSASCHVLYKDPETWPVSVNTLRTGDADLHLYITTVEDKWRKSAFLTRAWLLCTVHLITQYMENISEWSCWRMFIETWPHSELVVCDKYREQRALYLPLLLCSAFSQRSVTLQPWRKEVCSYEEKCLTEGDISAELLADTLSDVADDADSDSDSSIIGNRQNKIVYPLRSYSDSEQRANESYDDDETLDSAVSTWVKTDKTPNLGSFTGNPGVKQMPLTRRMYHK